MAPIRLRHPKGVTTIEVDVESETSTVTELQQIIFSNTEIPPSLQELKAGYPPQSFTLIPGLPISSLGLKRGDQLTVSEARGNGLSPSPSLRRSTAPSSSPAIRTSAALAPPTPRQSAPPRVSPGSQAEVDDHVETDGGILVHRVVPDDNSCLFSSVGVVFEQDMRIAPKLRQVVADAIRNDPETYTAAMLGHPPAAYIQTILKPTSWGGAIELAIFSDHYKTEIWSIDVETGRIDRFGQGKHFPTRCFLLYSGIHYDAVSLAPSAHAPPDFHQTVFEVGSVGMELAAQELATKLRRKRAFTNTATFDLKCQVCMKGLKGEKEARQHAKETGHAEFGEY